MIWRDLTRITFLLPFSRLCYKFASQED